MYVDIYIYIHVDICVCVYIDSSPFTDHHRFHRSFRFLLNWSCLNLFTLMQSESEPALVR